MRIARRKGREIDRAAAPGSVRATTSGPFLPRPGFKIFIYAFCAPTAPFRRTRATPSDAPQAARRAVRASATGRRTAAGGFSGNGTLFSDTQRYTQRIRASRHPPPSSLARPRLRGGSPIGRRTSPPGSPGARETKFSCTLVAHMWHFAYLCRRNTTSLGKRAIALLPPLYPSHFPHPTEHGSHPRHSRHASARPRPGTPPPASGHRRAATQAKACGRGGEGAPAGRHTGRRTGRKVIAFRERGLGWRRKARCGMPPRGKGEPRKGRPDRDKQKEGQPGLLLFIRGRARLHALVPKGRRPPRSAPIGHQRPLPRA